MLVSCSGLSSWRLRLRGGASAVFTRPAQAFSNVRNLAYVILEATNWRAEQAIRPMVVARKVWGGNRTAIGARTQSVLLSLIQTCRQQQRP